MNPLFFLSKLSLRSKIISLVIVALSLSTFSVLWLVTRLMIRDKISYIYDYNLSQVRAVSGSLETRINTAISAAQVGTTLLDAHLLKSFFDQALNPLGVKGMIFFRSSLAGEFRESGSQGSEANLAKLRNVNVLEALHTLVPDHPLAFPSSEGAISLVSRANSAQAKNMIAQLLVQLDEKMLSDIPSAFRVLVIDSTGKAFLSNSPKNEAKEKEQSKAIYTKLAGSRFNSGVLDWRFGAKDYILGYERIYGGTINVVSFISRSAAFEIVRVLVYQSLVMGLGILLLTLGVSILLVRRIIAKLQEMSFAAEKITEGDYSVQIQTMGMADDEVGKLAKTFNTMSSKISSTLQDLKKKRRMLNWKTTQKIWKKRWKSALRN